MLNFHPFETLVTAWRDQKIMLKRCSSQISTAATLDSVFHANIQIISKSKCSPLALIHSSSPKIHITFQKQLLSVEHSCETLNVLLLC